MIIKCNCKNYQQDKMYGAGNRVQNPTNDVDKKGYRCTVCGSTNFQQKIKKDN